MIFLNEGALHFEAKLSPPLHSVQFFNSSEFRNKKAPYHGKIFCYKTVIGWVEDQERLFRFTPYSLATQSQ